VYGELTRLADALDCGAAGPVTELVRAEVPPAVRDTPAGRAFVRQRVAALRGSGVAQALRELPGQVPLPGGAEVLRAVRAPALVLASHGDALHPVPVAERLAALLPGATLHVYDEPAVLWTRRADLRRRITGFLEGGRAPAAEQLQL
jgi:pimeloyl-ACP methyl ester carboxylesterase